jgi:hypothetical protein
MNAEFDTTELDQFTKDLLDLARVKMPQESKKFVRKEQGKLRTRTRQKARSKVHKQTGLLFANIDRSKVYDNGDDIVGKVYIRGGKNGAPHAHLIEEGHQIVGPKTHKKGQKKSGKKRKYYPKQSTGDRAKAYKIMEEARDEFEPVFNQDAESFVDEMLREKGL